MKDSLRKGHESHHKALFRSLLGKLIVRLLFDNFPASHDFVGETAVPFFAFSLPAKPEQRHSRYDHSLIRLPIHLRKIDRGSPFAFHLSGHKFWRGSRGHSIADFKQRDSFVDVRVHPTHRIDAFESDVVDCMVPDEFEVRSRQASDSTYRRL